MSVVSNPYISEQKGRGFYTALLTGFVAATAFVLLFSQSLIFAVIGIFFVILACSGVFAFVRGEKWVMRIENGVLSWAYPRWPKSAGSIELSTVRGIVIDDQMSVLTIMLADGRSTRIKLIGYAEKLRDYLAAHYSGISVDYIEGRG